ncbi:MAG: glycosyltransferase family 39 protein [Clostridiaceae bacterium]|nr:glycosyltransferase family 39 protein [Clostridiaceae bacterium]
MKSKNVKACIPFLMVFLAMWFLYALLYKQQLLLQEAFICQGMRFCLLALIAAAGILAFRRQLNLQTLVWLLILGGFVMRLGYTFYTPVYIRSHDLGDISLDGTGHAGYILRLFCEQQLPDSNANQFYQPPLFHFLAALSMWLFSQIAPQADTNTLFDAAKLVSCFASCCTLLLTKSICEELRCSSHVKVLVTGIIAFFPNFILMAGRVNNDAAATAFLFWAIYLTIRWYHTRKTAALLLTALAIGLGMMTKLSVGTMAFVTGPVMLWVFWEAVKNKTWVKQILQYLAFLGICAPLGLWFSIRNLIRFSQPLGYVLDIDSEGISFVYRGDHSILERFFSFPVHQFFETVYADPATDANLWAYLIRTSLFGEWTYENMDMPGRLLLNTSLLLILLSLAAMIYICFFDKKVSREIRIGVFLLWFVNMASYVLFNVRYPDACTMDFRYVTPTILCGALFLGIFWDRLREKNRQKKKKKDLAGVLQEWGIPVLAALFCLEAAWFYSSLS